MNQVNLIGRLTADPELVAPKGNPICRMRLAVDRASDGADFVTIVSFGTRAENDARWLSKGRKVAVNGRIHHNTWTDAEGNNRQCHEIHAHHIEYLDLPTPGTAPGAAGGGSNGEVGMPVEGCEVI